VTGHVAERTSPKGEAFIGKCRLCGKDGLSPKQVATEPCPSEVSPDEAVLIALDPPPPGATDAG
jgi:hypothetical protein